ncbi:MAG: hypothetical protein AB7G75_29935 [Candidatus Binatia bacterium]
MSTAAFRWVWKAGLVSATPARFFYIAIIVAIVGAGGVRVTG